LVKSIDSATLPTKPVVPIKRIVLPFSVAVTSNVGFVTPLSRSAGASRCIAPGHGGCHGFARPLDLPLPPAITSRPRSRSAGGAAS
jgi:hypothetical protein